ncbi:MAG: shikimate kinase [Alphaproteobacteria bacterium]|nr:shikimate kinase [Alphaproteobacteria bacterium]MDG1982718.1 shikimate kinase [Alphaproteobacteria bacterium]
MLIRQETNYLGKKPDHAQLTTIIGMMGAGKSKLGYIVSKSLNVNFYDIDDLIEKELNTSIKELFKSHGEAYFRSVEEAKIEIVIKNAVSKNEKAIISIGGGAFDNQYSRELLLKNTKVIWLNVPTDILIKRIGDGSKRPMIKGNIEKSITEILSKRVKYYSLSHHQLNAYNLTQKQITEKMIQFISPENKKDYR